VTLQGRPHNPFASAATSPDVAQYLFASGAERDALFSKIADAAWTAELLADHGRGKSTLVTTLLAEAESRGLRTDRIVLSEDSPRLPLGWKRRIAHAEVCAIDGGELLSRFAMWRLRRYAQKKQTGLIMTTHKQIGNGVLLEVETSPETFARFVKSLLADEDIPLHTKRIETMFVRHRGNAREALWELYMAWEKDLLAEYREPVANDTVGTTPIQT